MRKDQRRVHPDEADTRKAKAADRSAAAQQVWAELDGELKARDKNTERLRAARLARDGAIKSEEA